MVKVDEESDSETGSDASFKSQPYEEMQVYPTEAGDDEQQNITVDYTKALELKEEANTLFGKKQWDEALSLYAEALAYLPQRKSRPSKRGNEAEGNDNQGSESENEDQDTTESNEETISLRATLYSNMAACHVRLENWQDVVDNCTQALLDKPDYTKATARRAQANENIGTWSSLSAAMEDLKSLPSSPSNQNSIKRIEPILESQKKKETDEMLGKMKDLGNGILGKFGLSTDNFKFVQGEDGGYKVNFVNNDDRNNQSGSNTNK